MLALAATTGAGAPCRPVARQRARRPVLPTDGGAGGGVGGGTLRGNGVRWRGLTVAATLTPRLGRAALTRIVSRDSQQRPPRCAPVLSAAREFGPTRRRDFDEAGRASTKDSFSMALPPSLRCSSDNSSPAPRACARVALRRYRGGVQGGRRTLPEPGRLKRCRRHG